MKVVLSQRLRTLEIQKMLQSNQIVTIITSLFKLEVLEFISLQTDWLKTE